MSYIFDVILILVSGTACLYCWLLNKKLKGLQDMKKGLGASIITLSKAVSKTTQAATDAKLSAAESVERLNKLLGDVDSSIPKMDLMLETMERSSQRTVEETKALQKELLSTLRPLLDEAHVKTDELSRLLDEADSKATSLKGTSPEQSTNTFRRRASTMKDAG